MELGRAEAGLVDVAVAADVVLRSASTRPGAPRPGTAVIVVGLGHVEPQAPGVAGDRPAQDVAAAVAQGRGDPQDVVVAAPVGRDDLDHVGLAPGQRPRLVERQDAQPAELLEELPPLDQDARAAPPPPGALTTATGVAITRRTGRRSPARPAPARTSRPLRPGPAAPSRTSGGHDHHQHRDRHHDRRVERGEPLDPSARPAPGPPGPRGPGRRSARSAASPSGPGRLDLQRPLAVDRPGEDRRRPARGATGTDSPGDRLLIDARPPRDDRAVDRDPLAGADADAVAGPDLGRPGPTRRRAVGPDHARPSRARPPARPGRPAGRGPGSAPPAPRTARTGRRPSPPRPTGPAPRAPATARAIRTWMSKPEPPEARQGPGEQVEPAGRRPPGA